MQERRPAKSGVRYGLWISLLCLTGCGGSQRTITPPPVSGMCSGVSITGKLLDSLTRQPVAQGWAVAESGTQLAPSVGVYNFFPAADAVSSDNQGAFSICTQSVTQPSALVVVALDSGAKAYPPFVAAVSGSTDFGSIPMGGCTATCGFEGSQQTTQPATITGVITSTPKSISGTVVAQYPIQALDGSKSAGGQPNLWSLAMPGFNAAVPNTFTTTAGTCADSSLYCAAYQLVLPSEKPIHPATIGGVPGWVQEAGSPDYMIFAMPAGTAGSRCTQAYGVTALQQDGSAPLMGAPGAEVMGATIAFSNCQQ